VVKYDIKDFLGKGWHKIETDGFSEWVWSKKEAFLKFPPRNNGFSLYFSSGDSANKELLIYDMERGLTGRYIFDTAVKQVDILPPVNSIKISVAGGGICLRRIASLMAYRELSNAYPSVFEIETTTLCNMNPPCLMCDKSVPGLVVERPHISRLIIDKLKPYLKYAYTVSLTGVGEPLLCETLPDILNSVNSRKTFTLFNSNGLLLTKGMCLDLIAWKLGAIDFSIDAATAATYAKIRNKGKFSRLKHNIKQLATLKKEKNTDYPKIIINMVLMKENMEELPDFIELAALLGAQAVYTKMLKPLTENIVIKKGKFIFDYNKQILDTCSDRFRKIMLLSNKRADDLGVEFTGPDIKAQRPGAAYNIRKDCAVPVPMCKKPWTDALIGIDGSIRFCCHMQPDGRDQTMVIGNLNDRGFEDIWNGPVAARIRRQFINGVFPKECSVCPQYDTSNQ
jgi:MoaA/NifB/PqqE/SkfB family radical SAM enzyme